MITEIMGRPHKHDAELGELGDVLEPHFQRAFHEAFGCLQLYRIGKSVYVRGQAGPKLLAAGFFDGWMMAMRNK